MHRTLGADELQNLVADSAKIGSVDSDTNLKMNRLEFSVGRQNESPYRPRHPPLPRLFRRQSSSILAEARLRNDGQISPIEWRAIATPSTDGGHRVVNTKPSNPWPVRIAPEDAGKI